MKVDCEKPLALTRTLKPYKKPWLRPDIVTVWFVVGLVLALTVVTFLAFSQCSNVDVAGIFVVQVIVAPLVVGLATTLSIHNKVDGAGEAGQLPAALIS